MEYYEKFNNIVAVSDYCKESIIKKLPNMEHKIKIIYDIISPKLINEMSYENNSFDDNYKGIRILTIGRLVHLKGYDMAIEAAHRLKQEGYDFKWYSIGEGELRTKLEEIVREYGLVDNFIFIGTTHNPYTYLRQCDIYVQPSRYEGFGMAIAEAKILNKVIVATDFNIVYNQLENNKNGKIVDMNGESLYMGIKEILEDKNLRRIIKYNLSNENIGTENEILKLYDMIES